jgi:Gas vesicle protein
MSTSMSTGYSGQPVGPPRSYGTNRQVVSGSGTTNLADLLERVLDKGVVIAGDITVSLGQVELLQIKLRLIVASIDKAQEIGIDWWRSDPALSSHAKQMESENQQLKARLDRVEEHLRALPAPAPAATVQQSPAEEPGRDTSHASQTQAQAHSGGSG